MSPTVGHLPLRTNYGAAWYFGEPVKNQDARLSYLHQDLGLSVPISQDYCNEWSASVNVRAESYFTSAILPDTLQRFPAELWNVRFGTTYRHLFDNGWIAGATVNVGSASDKPFHSIDEMTVGTTAFLRVPQGEHNAWLFTLSLSSNSEVLPYIPIPGVAYLYAPSEWFQATIGFPFASVVYRPQEDLTLQLSYALLTTFHARATYRLAPHVRVFAAFDINNENSFLADRADVQDRFFYYDKELTGGLVLALSGNASLDLSGGYAFDRVYFEGTKSTSRDFNRVEVGDGPFVGLHLKVHF
jgi:hypothetical protein